MAKPGKTRVDIGPSLPEFLRMRKAPLDVTPNPSSARSNACLHRALAPLAISLLSVAMSSGCGTSCPEIVAHREAFSRGLSDPGPAERGADLRVSMPWSQVDLLLEEHALRSAREVELAPSALGAALSVSARIVGLRAHPAPTPDKVGLTLEVALERNRTRILVLELVTALAPEWVPARPPEAPGIRLALPPEALTGVKTRTTPEGRAMLSRWLERELPPAMKALGGHGVVDALADEILGWASAEVWPLLRAALPDGEALFSTVLALPELSRLGVRALTTEATASALVFGITTGVRAPALGRERPNPKRLSVTMTGPTATALISQAMDRGDVPGRFSSEGKPDASGPWEARVGWIGGSRPLHLHLWRVKGGCQRVEVGAQISLLVEGEEFAVDVREGRLMTLAGPPFAEAFAWLETLFGEALAFSFRTGALIALDATSGYSLGLVRAQFGDDVALEFELRRTQPTP